MLIEYDMIELKGGEMMRDIPVFTGEHGVASLTLSQIPYKQEAYIRIQSSLDPEHFLEECAGFCRAAGAERIFFTGYESHNYPVYMELMEMAVLRENLPDTDAALMPLQEKILGEWIEIYNRRMRSVPASSYMRVQDGKQLLSAGDAYFVHRGEQLLGIGVASGGTIQAIASVVPGAGRDVLLALNHALFGERVVVEVASENAAAYKLYTSLGFLPTRMILRWYQFL